ncbi:hypothetical protein TNIN_366391, partial [Trichonephila inaurata madagascariensis]
SSLPTDTNEESTLNSTLVRAERSSSDMHKDLNYHKFRRGTTSTGGSTGSMGTRSTGSTGTRGTGGTTFTGDIAGTPGAT